MTKTPRLTYQAVKSNVHLGTRALVVALACLLIATTTAAAASIPPSSGSTLVRAGVPGAAAALELASPYGEVARFGGYDVTGKTAGKFVLPVGFAVDPSDSSTS